MQLSFLHCTNRILHVELISYLFFLYLLFRAVVVASVNILLSLYHSSVIYISQDHVVMHNDRVIAYFLEYG